MAKMKENFQKLSQISWLSHDFYLPKLLSSMSIPSFPEILAFFKVFRDGIDP